MNIQDFSPHIFWSYKRSSDIETDIVIKQVIAFGEISDMILLSKKIDKSRILDVIKRWKGKEKYEKHINFVEKIIL